MIDSLRGELVERSPDHAVVECGGVGYLVYITADTYSRLPGKGACRLHVHYAVSVDVRSGQSEHKLYGFLDAEERHLFRQLITVQGVSSTIGLAILGARRAADLRLAIMGGDEEKARTNRQRDMVTLLIEAIRPDYRAVGGQECGGGWR